MTATSMLVSRVKAELSKLVLSPPPGVSCWPVGDSMVEFEAVIIGAEDTPYEKGEFKLSLSLPARYPMEPPRCLFKTKIYHPNIDEGGRICLDILNLPPKGSWKPSLNISTVLISLRLLLSHPNPDDPLVAHISEQFVADYEVFARTAKAYTKEHAMSHIEVSAARESINDTTGNLKDEKQNSDSPAPFPSSSTSESAKPTSSDSAPNSSLKRRPTDALDVSDAPSSKKSKHSEEAPKSSCGAAPMPLSPPKKVALGGLLGKVSSNPSPNAGN